MLDAKWTGTAFDRRDMRTLNIEQVVRRNFGKLAMFGFASCLLATWESIALTLTLSLSNGGTAGLFWNYVITTIGFGFVYASIAELGSMLPTSGGQYYWVAVLAPRRYRRYLSYITGWLCAITWQTSVAGGSFLAGTIIEGLLILNVGTYQPKNWHGSLISLAIVGICIVFNTILARKLPLVEGVFVFLHILGIVMIIPLWILSPRREGGSPVVDFYNPSGWASNGLATLVGLTGPITALIGFDCSVHMAEEAKDSSRTVPVTLLVGYTVNVSLGFLALMACIYTIGPLESALNNPNSTGFVFIDMLFTATKSYSGVNFMAAILIINLTASSIAGLAAASRQLWAFARNKGVPFATWFAPAQLPFDIPLHAIAFSLILPVAIILINIGSSEALGILLSIYNSALVGSYIITIACVLLHRLQGRSLPKARYSLGKWGILVNTIALLFVIPMFVFSFFPPVPKPTAANMNWAIVLVGGIVILASAYYVVWGRKTFTPPHETVEDYIKRYEATTASERESDGGVVEEPAEKETVTGESAEAES